MISIRPEEIKPLAQYVYTLSGISLDEKKAYLFESRFGPMLDDLGLNCYTDLIAKADIGAICYVVDNQTVAKTDNSTARKAAGKIIDVDADGVWVEVG